MKSGSNGDGRGLVIATTVALLAGLLYGTVTPPGRVPDETGHFLRAVSIAEGDFFPEMGPSAPGHHFPLGIRMFLFRLAKDDPATKFTMTDIRAAWAEPLRPDERSGMEFPAWYTPAPYMVTVAVAFVGLELGWRPFVIFYLGRAANLLATLAVIAAGVLLVARRAAVFGAALLLPMTLYQLSSWSADAMTIALAFLLTSLLVRNIETTGIVGARELSVLAVVAFTSALCKPAYFLLVVPVLFIPRSRFGSGQRRTIAVTIVAGAMALGTLLAVLSARAEHYHPKRGLPVDPAQQLACVRADPIRFVRVAWNDMRMHGRFYLEETVGRLGTMNIKLPPALIVGEWLLLLSVAVTAGMRWKPAQRLVVLGICAAMIGGISLAQYLVWSVICGDLIEGIQGRYYLPFLPLLLLALSPSRQFRGPSLTHVGLLAIVGNGIALAVLIEWSWL